MVGHLLRDHKILVVERARRRRGHPGVLTSAAAVAVAGDARRARAAALIKSRASPERSAMSWPTLSALLSQQPRHHRPSWVRPIWKRDHMRYHQVSLGVVRPGDIACALKLEKALSLLGVILGTRAHNEVQTPSSRTAAHNASTEATSDGGTVNRPSRVYSPALAVTS
jgi:hypothetical protein